MKIIEPGIIKHAPLLRFTCQNCSCIFEASETEYDLPDWAEELHDRVKAKCKCPCCGYMVYLYYGGES